MSIEIIFCWDIYCQTQNYEHLKNFRNVDCVVANNNKVQNMQANLNKYHKLIATAIRGLVSLCLIGFFLGMQ